MLRRRALGTMGALTLSMLSAGCTLPNRANAELAAALANRACVHADGPLGYSPYDLVTRAFGPAALELPDSFHSPKTPHLREENLAEVGSCFVFTLHRDVDRDPVNWDRTDRQRAEMKIYDASPEHLKGYEGTTFSYSWRFRIGSELPLTRRFSHFFQLKAAKSPDDQQPVITFTGARSSGMERFQIRHSASKDHTVLAELDWAEMEDHWIEARVQVVYLDAGSIRIELVRSDGRILLELERRGDLDLWRGGGFVRPKWGFYRSLAEAHELSRAEDSVRFASIGVTPGATRETCWD
jgi:hypothetical protein